MYRFYLPSLAASRPDSLQLPEDQAHHALSVLRLTPNTPVLLFDGLGRHAPALITAASKRSLTLKLTAPITTDPSPNPALTIAVAVPKADRADWLIEQASQLNVTKIQWLTTDRTVVKPKEAKLEKHHRLAIESAKQCHRTHLLEISAPLTLEYLLKKSLTPKQAEGLQSLGSSQYDQILWLDPDPENSRPIRAVLPTLTSPIPNTQYPIPNSPRLLALIGPEGGWSPRERDLLNPLAAQNKITRIRLTPTILRIETAAAALAAIIMCSESSP
jgi:16S rRNA (uracil1498-N3)-methyltransferase